MSLIVLVRCTTGEGWNKIMRELSVTSDIDIERYAPDGSVYIDHCVNK